MAQLAVMNIEKGEEIIAGFVSGHITGTGRYKFLAKKMLDNNYEWAHFVERDNGLKENVFRGSVKNREELKLVLSVMNKNLKKIFGPNAEMKEGIPEIKNLLGNNFDTTIN